MEENKTNDLVNTDHQKQKIKEEPVQEDNKKRLKKRIFNLIYDVLILIGIGCLLYGGYSLYEGYRDSKEAEQSHEDLKDNYVDFGLYKNDQGTRRFVNGLEYNLLLDFNVDGVIYDLI